MLYDENLKNLNLNHNNETGDKNMKSGTKVTSEEFDGPLYIGSIEPLFSQRAKAIAKVFINLIE